jgi:predicted Zn-dependent protease
MDATLLKKERWLSRKNVLFAGGAFFCAVLFFQCGAMFARWKYTHVSDIYLNRQLSEELLQKISLALKQAAQFDPFEGIYPALQGDVQRYLGQPAKALEYYMLAGRKDPLDGAYLQQIAMMLPQDQHERAERLMAQGSKRTVKKDDLLLSRAQWLLDTSQRERAIDVLRQGLEENSKLVNSVLSLLDGFSLTREELAVVLPKSVEVWLQSAHFFENNGKAEDAAFLRRQALDFLEHEETIRPEWFSQLYNSFKKQKDDEKALEVLRLGISKLPRYPRFHEWLGDYYAKEGIVYRAQEEYQQVLLLEPLNESVRRKVEKVSKLQ